MPDAFARLRSEFFGSAGPCAEQAKITNSVFNTELLALGLQTAGICEPGASPAQIVALYLDRADCRMFSPNPLFDEIWYRFDNPDVSAEIADGLYLSGLQHFLCYGLHEGRWPNAALAAQAESTMPRPECEVVNASLLLDSYPSARAFLASFPGLDCTKYYNLYGRRLGNEATGLSWHSPVNDLLASEFDAEFYRRHYMAAAAQDDAAGQSAFAHYLTVGIAGAHSPNAWFDEGFYRAYYPDVAGAVGTGSLLCGFHHFLMYGRQEGRFPAHDLTLILEKALPGVTQPALLRRVDDLRAKIGIGEPKPDIAPATERRRVWFIFPIVNPDIAFGGYQAAFALMVELHRAGFKLGVICMEDTKPNQEYFVWRQKNPEYRDVFSDCPFYGSRDYDALPLRRGDLFVVYSVWGLELGGCLAALAGETPPYLFAQEYEPIFYANDALQVLCEEYYRRPHYPIINSRFLFKFFRDRQIGAFQADVEEYRNYAVFEHALTVLPRQSAAAMAGRSSRSMVIYARPEAHAGRNLFDIIAIALQDLCEEGIFGAEWSFTGLGALSDLPDLRLSDEHRLTLRRKVDAHDYAQLMGGIDIGLSLMCAPHPSLVPFEMAMTGALVVTNTFANRSAEELTSICGNIVACELGLDALKAAIRSALSRVNDFDARERNAYEAGSISWRQSFNPTFIERVFGQPGTALPATQVPRADDVTDVRRTHHVMGRFLNILARRQGSEGFSDLVRD